MKRLQLSPALPATPATTLHDYSRSCFAISIESKYSHNAGTACTDPVAGTCGRASVLRNPHTLQPAATASAAARPAFLLFCVCRHCGSLCLPRTPPAAAAAQPPAAAPPAWTLCEGGCCHQRQRQHSHQLSLQLSSPLCRLQLCQCCAVAHYHCIAGSQRRIHASINWTVSCYLCHHNKSNAQHCRLLYTSQAAVVGFACSR